MTGHEVDEGCRAAAATPPEPSLHLPDPGADARGLFGDRLPVAVRYAGVLASDGVAHGLLGPREVPRLWDRHLVNGAAVAALVPRAASVCDVGSGAGLPGIPLAIARPDLRITLVEPLARRAAFLRETVVGLGLDTVTVLRGRVDGRAGGVVDADGRVLHTGPFDVVTARAVAALDRLLPWLLPLARAGGVVLAVKGASAEQEVAAARDVLDGLHAQAGVVVLGSADDPVARVVRVDVPPEPVAHRGTGRRSDGGRRA